MKIRQYSTADYSAVLAVYSSAKLDELKYEQAEFELLPLDKDEIRYTQLFESDIFVYGDKDILAFCALCGSEIRALFVHPKARGQGIGIKLLEFMLDKINADASLYVAASNFPAITLYQRYGFKTSFSFTTTYNETAVVANKMERQLDYSE